MTVFTIGHSTLTLDSFLNILKKAEITAVADVRSAPFSRRSPHFSREDFRHSLKEIGIKYVFLGKELGGRPRSSNLYCDGVADYEKMALEPAFKKGIDRVVEGSKEHRIVLMCSERNPLDCHRCLLVGRALSNRNVLLKHILGNDRIVTQNEIEDKLLELTVPSEKEMDDMFANRAMLLANSYRARAKAVAYREPAQTLAESNSSYGPNHAT